MEKNLNELEIKVVVTSIDYEHSDKEFCFYGQDVSFYADVYDVKTNKKLFSNLYLSEKICGIGDIDFDVADYLYDDDEILEFWENKDLDPEVLEDLHKLEDKYDYYLDPEDRYREKWSRNKLEKLYFDEQWMSDYLAEYYDSTFFENDYFEDYTLGEFFVYLAKTNGNRYSTVKDMIDVLAPELTKNDIIEIFGEDEIWIFIEDEDFWNDGTRNIDEEFFEILPDIIAVNYDINIYHLADFDDLLVKKYFGSTIRVNKYWYKSRGCGLGNDRLRGTYIKIKDLDKVFGENFEK